MLAEQTGSGGARTDAAGQGEARLVFSDVRFRYGPDLPEVLRGVSVDVPAVGMTAFVGPSGAGKSTRFGLVERFREPDSGRILLDGRDLADWDLVSGTRSSTAFRTGWTPLSDTAATSCPAVSGNGWRSPCADPPSSPANATDEQVLRDHCVRCGRAGGNRWDGRRGSAGAVGVRDVSRTPTAARVLGRAQERQERRGRCRTRLR